MSTLEKRVEDLEFIIAHLPEDLNARFAGVDVKLAHIREAQALHTTRFSALDARVDLLAADVAGLKSDVAVLKADMAVLKSDVAVLKADMSLVKSGISEILSRLPPAA
jgi:hypothetical protein